MNIWQIEYVWKCGGIDVYYHPDLDGDGTNLAPSFLDFIGSRYPARRFRVAYEWCAGPGFIGFAMLSHGLCDELVVADVNPEAIRYVEKTIARNDLAGRVRCYVGDNLSALPSYEKFDLVVANPPNYYAINRV